MDIFDCHKDLIIADCKESPTTTTKMHNVDLPLVMFCVEMEYTSEMYMYIHFAAFSFANSHKNDEFAYST